jgi:sterol desaturase/sphingolipid hydroxylase (fatty acid hydroxylase superfamily)
LESEAVLRFSIFATVFAALAAAEMIWPLRAVSGRAQRWACNLGMQVLNTILLRLSFLVVPALPVLAAFFAEQNGWGLLPILGLTGAAGAVGAFIVLDAAVYGQHVAMHKIPVLWRLHRVHHADPEFDVTTGLRFHPLEIAISQVWKIAVIFALGAPAIAVLIFEIALNAGSMFTHANVGLGAADRFVRAVIVTPDMHRVHHSIAPHETDSNYGFNLSVWDRAFGTYREAAAGDPATMPIGLGSFRGAEPTRLPWLLAFPFVREPRA